MGSLLMLEVVAWRPVLGLPAVGPTQTNLGKRVLYPDVIVPGHRLRVVLVPG